jgi:hypothetical protein
LEALQGYRHGVAVQLDEAAGDRAGHDEEPLSGKQQDGGNPSGQSCSPGRLATDVTYLDTDRHGWEQPAELVWEHHSGTGR